MLTVGEVSSFLIHSFYLTPVPLHRPTTGPGTQQVSSTWGHVDSGLLGECSALEESEKVSQGKLDLS